MMYIQVWLQPWGTFRGVQEQAVWKQTGCYQTWNMKQSWMWWWLSCKCCLWLYSDTAGPFSQESNVCTIFGTWTRESNSELGKCLKERRVFYFHTGRTRDGPLWARCWHAWKLKISQARQLVWLLLRSYEGFCLNSFTLHHEGKRGF